MKLDDLRKKYPVFIYQGFETNLIKEGLEISFSFSIEPGISFNPKVIIKQVTPEKLEGVEKGVIDNFAFHLGLIEIPSYWKVTCSPQIVVSTGSLDSYQIDWWTDLLLKGMGQFFYENKINFKKKNFVRFLADNTSKKIKGKAHVQGNGILIPLGGGKDSALTTQLLGRNFPGRGAFILKSIGVRSNIEPSIQMAKKGKLKDLVLIERVFDRKLFELNKKGFLNGHTPFSAYLAFLSVLCGYIFKYKNVAFSNEKSSNEENIKYLSKSINHQYTKTFEFEEKFREYNREFLSNINYFSFLRPLYEIQIAKIFSHYPKYFNIVRSCNVGIKQNSWEWCSRCSKCLSTFILLYPFFEPKRILQVFPGNLYKDESLFPLLDSLVSPEKVKPFECVGTREELKIGLYLSMKKNIKQPILLAMAREKYLSKEKNWEKRTEKVLNNWDKNNNLSPYFQNILKRALYG